MKSTLKPIDVSNSVTPMSEDNDSNFPPPDEDSQPVYGPSKEENAKLGFGGLKLGMTLHRLLAKYQNLDGLSSVFLIIFVCDKLQEALAVRQRVSLARERS